jgi:pimeloyl-ACP methyl ester carboxylesterase
MTGSILPVRHAMVARTGTGAPCRSGRGWCRRAVLGLAACLVAVAAAGNARPVAAADAIESIYKAAGSYAVSTASVTEAGGAVLYTLYYPTNLGAGDLRHPIITWGNGTYALPSHYWGLLTHLASWGFVVVASTDLTTGAGAEILAAAHYMVQQDSDPGSIFYQKLDTARVGAIGHSQGAGGVVNATNHSSGLIKTTVPIALPHQIWVSPGDEYDVQLLTVPVLFLGGANDIFIASPATLTGYYNQVPGAAAVAVLKGAGHNTIQQTGGGFLGYINAWMMYLLRNDNTARGAFVGAPPEINTNAAWQNRAEKNLP